MKYIFTLLALILFAGVSAQQTVYHVKGRFLTDPCGDTVILRGVNKMVIWRWDIDGLTSLAEIAKTGANCVRIVWDYTGTADMLNTALTTCENLKMIPIIEQHDDNPSDPDNEMSSMPIYLSYWMKPDILAVVKAHQNHLLLNIVNELGTFNTTLDEYIDAYKMAIDSFRNEGVHAPLVVDGSGYGQNITMLEDAGPTLTAYDPDHNILYSVHLYWQYNYGDTDDEVTQTLQQSVDNNLPLIVGEFCKYETNGDSGEAVSYKNIIAQCNAKKIGYIAWEWGPGNLGDNNKAVPWVGFTTDGTFATLNGWGLEVSMTSPDGINKTAKKSNFLLTGLCESSLPVGLIDLTAENTGKENKLTWITASETNNKGFYVERSAETTNFTAISFVPTKAVGSNSNQNITYQYSDAFNALGTTYYRLKQVDKDGGIFYSKIVSVNNTAATGFAVYPNPAKSAINVSLLASINGKITVVITDITGRKLITNQSVTSGQSFIPITVNQLSLGLYFLTVTVAGKTLGVTKLVKQ